MRSREHIRVLVVDDHFMVRLGLSASLNVEPDIKVVAEAGNAEAALKAYRQHSPGVVIMDVRLPGTNGIEAAAAMMREFPGARILMLSTYGEEEAVYRALQAGAHGYVLKNVAREELLRAIRSVHAGIRYVDSVAAKSLAEHAAHPALTAREIEVLRMIVRGLSNKEIANTLGVAEVTVKQHVTHVLEKLGASDRTQAATLAIQRGMVQLEC
jgi:DNA-binding NarL/FixJ family response regulator